jgi:RNA polymerase-interacting CarD/CdnL/TRCF family regulator
MEHNPGDFVVHPHHGVGQIIAIEEMEFVATEKTVFYRVGFEKTTIWIEVESRRGIRPIIPKADLAQYRQVLESPPVSFDSNFNVRQNDLEKRLQNLTFQILCEIVRDLNGLSETKVLNNYEKNLFKRTSRFLRQEWAVSSGTPVEEINRLILNMLQKSSVK